MAHQIRSFLRMAMAGSSGMFDACLFYMFVCLIKEKMRNEK
jgi:hypothetical protein